MKKVLGLLALTLAVSSVSFADQDVLKNISLDSRFSQTYYDKDGTDANLLGNEGFKKKNKERFRWTEEVEGTLGLNDEWGLDANFFFRNHSGRYYDDGKMNGHKDTERLTNFELAKQLQIGSLDTVTKFGWRNWTYRDNGGVRGASQSTIGQSNEFYFGPTFNWNLFGQNVSTTAQAVYFNQSGTAEQDGRYYVIYDKNGVDKKTDGWGANLIFNIRNNIFENNFGKANYYIDLAHYLRDGNGKNAKNSVGLVYLTGLGYETPSWGGVYAGLNIENEFKKRTALSGYTSEFSVWTHLGYRAEFDTAVGVITINPRVAYRPVNKNVKRKHHLDRFDNEAKGVFEENDLTFGVKVGLAVK